MGALRAPKNRVSPDHVRSKTHSLFLARRKRRAKNKSGFNKHLSQLDISAGFYCPRDCNLPTLNHGVGTSISFKKDENYLKLRKTSDVVSLLHCLEIERPSNMKILISKQGRQKFIFGKLFEISFVKMPVCHSIDSKFTQCWVLKPGYRYSNFQLREPQIIF